MKKYRPILYCVIALFIFACRPSSEYPEKMLRAEQCMDIYPDSALAMLDSLQSTIRQEPEETQMYYHLLTIRTRYKCYLPCTSDSLITILADYYRTADNRERLMEALYMKGCIYDELQDMPRALKCYQEALQLSEGSKQYHTLALIYSQIGNVYLYQDMEKEAIPMFRNAYHYFELAKVDSKLQYPIRDIARAYSNLQRKDSTIHYYKEACMLAKRNKNRTAENDILYEFGAYYVVKGDYDLAVECLSASDASKSKNQNTYYHVWGLFYQHTNRPDSAKYYFQKSIATKGSIYTTAGTYLHLAELEAAAGNHREAYRLICTHRQWQDSIRKITNTETAQRMYSLYNYQRTEAENQKLKEENMQKKLWLYRSGIVMTVLIAIGTGYVVYRKQKKRETAEREKRIHETMEKQYAKSMEQIAKNNSLIDELQLKLSQTEKEKQILIEARQRSLEAMNNQIRSEKQEREIKEDALRKSDIYIYFHSQKSGAVTEQEWEQLKLAIDDTYDNFTGQLYTLCPKLSVMEVRICHLIKISITVTNISVLLGRSKSTISTARNKLYEKLQAKKGTPEMLDELIAGF